MKHQPETDPLKPLVKAWGEQQEAALKMHYDELVLSDYVDGCLSEDEMEDVRGHIAICRACTKVVDQLQTPFVLESGLPSAKGPQQLPLAKYALAIAAAILLAFGIGFFINNTSRFRGGPITIITLASMGSTRGDQLLQLPPGMSQVALSLVYAGSSLEQTQRARLMEQSTELLSMEPHLQKDGSFSLLLPTRVLEPGHSYILELEAGQGQDWHSLARYRFRVQGQ